MNEYSIFLPFLLILWLASYMATKQNINALDIVPCTKISWKIQIWSQIWGIRCITSSNLTYFDNFGALFFLFQIHMTAFPYESKTCRNFWQQPTNQLFVLFHLVGVTCWAYVGVMNFWHDLQREVKILT